MNPSKRIRLELQRDRINRGITEKEYVKMSTKDLQPVIQTKKLVPVSDKPIIGFWHICMINNYKDIISEQRKLILESGLYDKSEHIFVGCSGSFEELENAENLLSHYPKFKLLYYPILSDYEFSTLKYIQAFIENRNTFFAFYIHTKAVSHPISEGGKHWRDYMNYYNITRFQDNIDKLKEGYDTCGVKLIPPGNFPYHYSGNFWWANSDYIKTLKPIHKLDTTNRFEAEMWICSNNPNAATLCQKFVDYNTKGKFTVGKNKVIVHTLAYNLPSEVKDAVTILYQQNESRYFEHVIVDLGFPITKGDQIPRNIERSKLMNTQNNIDTALTFGSKFLSFPNEGVSQNWERVRKHFDIQDGDVLICADPDERPKNHGWVKAISDVITNGKKIAWCSLMMKEHEPHVAHLKKTNIAGHDCYLMDGGLNWAQGGFSGKFLNDIGEIPVPTGAPIYGWIEDACVRKMRPLEYQVAILADYYVEHTECSPLYRAWKTEITSNVKKGQITFDEWLIKQNEINNA